MNVWTLTNLPTGGHVTAWLTADRRTDESDAFGAAAESGWVDPRFSATELFESRNDVEPIFAAPTEHLIIGDPHTDEDPADIRQALLDAIREWVGHADSSQDGTIYAADVRWPDQTTGDFYAYAVHVQVKYRASSGEWVQEPVQIDIADINA